MAFPSKIPSDALSGAAATADVSRSVATLARALVTAARTRTLYPPDHSIVGAAVDRLVNAAAEVTADAPLEFGVTPDTLVLDGEPAAGDRALAETATWLHRRDIVKLAFDTPPQRPAIQSLVDLLALEPASLRREGGAAQLWKSAGHPGIRIDQLDLQKVLENNGHDAPHRSKDDLWRAIVRSALDRRSNLDALLQQRLLDISGDPFAIGELTQDVMAPNCTADGSPMLTSRAAAVVAAYRHLMGAVDVLAPERRTELLNNLASATTAMDSRVVLQLFSLPANGSGAAAGDEDRELQGAIAAAMDDEQIARLLATTLALDGRASDRLASVFGTIAPDEERRTRVLRMARTLLSETAFGATTDFNALWTATEELLLSYSERPFVSTGYRESLDNVGERAARMAESGLADDLSALVATLEPDNVRRLSVTLLVDLFHLERDPARAPELARDLATACEDLLLAGDYEGAVTLTTALAAHAGDANAPGAEGARVALDGLVTTTAFRDAAGDLTACDATAATQIAAICAAVGSASVDALLPLLNAEEPTTGLERATAIIRQIGGRAAGRLAPLVASSHWYAQRNVAEILGDLGVAEGVPLLQPLLRGRDPRVTRAAIRALSNIDDPSAARCVHTVMRAAAGEQRQAVVTALVQARDARVVPLLGQILDDSDALGSDHAIVLETLGAVGAIGGDAAIPSVERVMRKRKWFARQRVRALIEASMRSLSQVGTPAARAAIARAASGGDRQLKRAARQAGIA